MRPYDSFILYVSYSCVEHTGMRAELLDSYLDVKFSVGCDWISEAVGAEHASLELRALWRRT